jgi:dodecin
MVQEEPDPFRELRRRKVRRGGLTARGAGRARLWRRPMGAIIVREMVGTSALSWSDAARQAVALASKTVRNIRTVEVIQSSARVENGEIVEYRVQIKLGFEYES